jgi:hypothetical protein
MPHEPERDLRRHAVGIKSPAGVWLIPTGRAPNAPGPLAAQGGAFPYDRNDISSVCRHLSNDATG